MMTLHGRKQDKGRQDNGRSCQHSKCLNKMAALEKKGLKHKWIKRYIKQNHQNYKGYKIKLKRK